MGHSLSTNMQYSKHIGVQRLINNQQQPRQQLKNQNLNAVLDLVKYKQLIIMKTNKLIYIIIFNYYKKND